MQHTRCVAYNDSDFIRDYNSILSGTLKLTVAQENIITFGKGPLLVSAGPGSGKSECLVARTLRLLIVEGVKPEEIMVTTFTRKAARGLVDRIVNRLEKLKINNPKNTQIQNTTSQGVKVGTIHNLAQEILTDCRTQAFNDAMVIDEIPLKMLLLNQSRDPYRPKTHPLRVYCEQTFGGSMDFCSRLIRLYHHIIEDQIDLEKLDKAGGTPLIASYNQYRLLMGKDMRIDFAILLEMFLNNLLSGTLSSIVDKIKYVLVDEYQDTNPIQEDIFFALAKKKNICVVGDDDQALYRFRGASVECMVNFESECLRRWKIKPSRINLLDNFRSHPRIVDFSENYMNSHPSINQKHIRLRVNGKPPLGKRGRTISEHPALTLCHRDDEVQTDEAIAKYISKMISTRVVEDASQIVILSPSVNESTKTGVSHLTQSLELLKVPVYNPRGKDLLQTEEVMCLFGTISCVIDMSANYKKLLHAKHHKKLIEWISECRNIASGILASDTVSQNYLKNSHRAISNAPDDTSYSLVGAIMTHILNLPPFKKYTTQPESSWRLAAATNWIEQYSLTPGKKNVPAFLNVFVKNKQIADYSLGNFYVLCCQSFLIGRTPEHEDEDQIIVPGHVSVMTIHQAKGLEFDVVIVRGTKVRNKPKTTAKLYSYFAPLRKRPIKVYLNEEELRNVDEFRAFYVAYSRAKHVLMLHDPKNWKNVPHNRGYIGQDVTKTHDYVNKFPDAELI